MPIGTRSSGDGRAIGVHAVVWPPCVQAPSSVRPIAAIDNRRFLRFAPGSTFIGRSLSGRIEGATSQMPHVKLRDGAELYYEKHGNGPPLFLVPGLGGDGRWWGENVAKLASHFTVVVHDHRGTGRSTLSRIAYSVAQMA